MAPRRRGNPLNTTSDYQTLDSMVRMEGSQDSKSTDRSDRSDRSEYPDFNNIKISTKTVMAYPNCSFILSEYLANAFPINEITPPNAKESADIINPKPGFYQIKSVWGCRGIAPPNAKKAFRNQITVLIYWNNCFCNIKIFPTGKFHMTGCRDKKSYTLAAIKLLNTIRSFHTPENPTIEQNLEDVMEGTMPTRQEPLTIEAYPMVDKLDKLDKVDKLDKLKLDTKVVKSTKRTKNDKKNASEPTPIPLETTIAPTVPTSVPVANSMAWSMIFDVVMVNIDFNLGFKIDQLKLADVLNETTANEFYPVFESTGSTSVNIKLDYPVPTSKRYDKYYIDPDYDSESPILQSVFTTECKKTSPKKLCTHTFLVFSSGKVIQSGAFYDTEMKTAYAKFCKFVTDHKSVIQVDLTDKSAFDFSQLRGLAMLLQ